MGFDLTIELVDVSESDKAPFLRGEVFSCTSLTRDDKTGFWNQSVRPGGMIANWRNQRDVARWFMGWLVNYDECSYMYVPQHVLKALVAALFRGDVPQPDGDTLELRKLYRLANVPAAEYPLVSVMWG